MTKLKLVTIIFLTALILTINMGCEETNLQGYEISLGAASENIFISSNSPLRDLEKIQTYNNKEAIKEISYQFNGQVYTLTYQETKYCELWGYERNVYEFGDDLYYAADQTGTVYVVSASGDYYIAECDRELKDEADYKEWIEDYIKNNIPQIDLSEYKYKCKTHVVVDEEDYFDNRHYDGFYSNPKKDEVIEDYDFTYVKMHKGYETTDMIYVNTDKSGNIKMVQQLSRNIDWTKCPDIDCLLHNIIPRNCKVKFPTFATQNSP